MHVRLMYKAIFFVAMILNMILFSSIAYAQANNAISAQKYQYCGMLDMLAGFTKQPADFVYPEFTWKDKLVFKFMNWMAERNEPNAETMIGMYYDSGYMVPRDRIKATELYTAAAQQDFAFAEYIMGIRAIYGIGMTADKVAGLTWLQKFLMNLEQHPKMPVKSANMPDLDRQYFLACAQYHVSHLS